MRKLLNNPLFVAALALVAVVGIGWDYIGRAPAPAVANVDDGLVAEETPVEEGAEAPRGGLIAALNAVKTREVGRDPFASASRPARDGSAEAKDLVEVVERLRLSACWVQNTGVLLVLNGRICQPGDSVDRFTVESAAIDGAWIIHGGERSFLAVGQELAVRSFAPAVTPLPK